MNIGEVIRRHRREKGMTQEEMASRLGITAPAVNKWENGNTMPDITLLAPISRLLGITPDKLLSFREELTEEEIADYVGKIHKDLDEKEYREVFEGVRRLIEEYPNCGKLICQAASVLDFWRREKDLPDKDEYEETVIRWYEMCLEIDDDAVKRQAADFLFYVYFQKGEFEKAEKFTEYRQDNDPERKRKKALIFSKTGRKEEAYRAYEELIFTSYQQTQLALNDLRVLYMEDGDRRMAEKITGTQSRAAAAFEMGRFNEVSSGLDVAVWENDAGKTERIVKEMMDSLDTISAFTGSDLYRHMILKEPEPGFTDRLRAELISSFHDAAYDFMLGNEYWKGLTER